MHRAGRHVDLRPLRTDGARGPVSIIDGLYSRERTSELVKALLASSDVMQVLFNDYNIGRALLRGTHNHLHGS